MKDLLKKHADKLRFGLVGGANTALDFAILFILRFFGLHEIAANIISTSVAFVFSFFANRTFTFRSSGSALKQFLPFVAISIFSLWGVQTVVILLVQGILPIEDKNIELFIAKLIATAASLVSNYILYKFIVFKDKA